MCNKNNGLDRLYLGIYIYVYRQSVKREAMNLKEKRGVYERFWRKEKHGHYIILKEI